MFSKEMEALIEATLADGELTDQEKTALVNRAEKEGVDLNELEIYIQSILQKRQQELDKKSREARAEQEEADLEGEKLRAKTLRVCPKCGAKIPHLSNACPDCGFVIEKTELDEKLAYLKQLLEKCHEDLTYLGGQFQTDSPRAGFQITQEEYNKWSRFLKIRNCGHNDAAKRENCYYVNVDFEAVLAEASLYKSNESISNSLNKISTKKKDLLLEQVDDYIRELKKILRVGSSIYGDVDEFEDNMNKAKKSLNKVKNISSDYFVDEILEKEQELKQLQKKFDDLQDDPKFQEATVKAAKKRSGCLGIVILLIMSAATLSFALL